MLRKRISSFVGAFPKGYRLSRIYCYYFSSSFELFVMSIMQEDVYIHCVSAHARYASLKIDWGHHDG